MKLSKTKLFLILACMATVFCSTNIEAAEKDQIDPRKIVPLFKRHCAICHGYDGKGQTKGGRKAGVKDYSNPKVAEKLKDTKKMTASILKGMKDKNGKMLMFPFERKLKPQETIALIKYLEKFSQREKQ